MADLLSEFNAATTQAKSLAKKPDNQTLLKMYALYKQATTGDVAGKRPGFTDPVGQAKYDAWTRVKGLSQEGAMQQYIDLVKILKGS
jgi:acyl-CoA-binding protein